MRKILAFVALVPLMVSAQGVQRPYRQPEANLFASYRNATLANTGVLGGIIMPNRSFRLERVNTYVTVQGGGGAGNTVVTITDGTNNCTATWTCVATGTIGMKAAALAGTCTFPAGATVTASVTTAGCSTTQPTVVTMSFLGYWL